MRSTKNLLFACLAFLSFSGNSQSKITGNIKDSALSGIPYCPLVLLNALDSSQVKGNLSDSTGRFIFEKIKPGKYFIKVSPAGYKSSTTAVFSYDSISDVTLPTIITSNEGLNLKEINVAVYKPLIEFKKGIVTMNIEDDILARGNTVLDLLKRVPGVIIDAQNNIIINGASGARFLIDDRMQQIPTPQILDMLAGMSADLVSKIELIKNPPARYDAAGTGGLINIVTKKAKVDGYNGNFGLNASMGKRFRVGPNGSFNYKSKNLSFFSNLSFTYRDLLDVNTLNRSLLTTNGTETINSTGQNESFQRILSGSGGIEYDISKKTLLGLYINGNASNDEYRNDNSTQVQNSSFFNYAKTNFVIDDKYKTASPNLNLSVLHKIDTTGGEIKLRLGYNNYTENEAKVITNHFYNTSDLEIAPVSTYSNDSKRTFEVYTAKLDLNKTFKNKLNLESGLSATLENDYSNTLLKFFNQSTGFFVGDTSFYNTLRFRQDVYAAYSTVSRSWDKFGFSAGLRAEQTNVDIKYVSSNYFYIRNYLSLFPSGSIDYTINKKHSLSGAYSYRIRRPHYGMLNPVRQFNDQLNFNVGNSEIRPQFSHNFTLDYNFNQFINVTIGHEQTKDFTFWYSYTPNNSRVIIDTISNLPHFTNTYVSVSAQKRIKWYSFQTYWVVTQQAFQGSLVGQDVSSRSTQFYLNLNQEFYLPKDFKIQIWAGRGSAIRHGPQLYHARSAIHLSVNKAFLNKKLNITVGLNDVLYRDFFSCTTTYSDQTFFQKNVEDSRRVRFSVSYRFGKMQFQQRLKEENSQAGGQGR